MSCGWLSLFFVLNDCSLVAKIMIDNSTSCGWLYYYLEKLILKKSDSFDLVGAFAFCNLRAPTETGRGSTRTLLCVCNCWLTSTTWFGSTWFHLVRDGSRLLKIIETAQGWKHSREKITSISTWWEVSRDFKCMILENRITTRLFAF